MIDCRIAFAIAVCGALIAAPSAWADPLEDALAATFRVANPQSSATCFLVRTAPPTADRAATTVLVTAAHFFEGTAERQCQLMLRGRNADDSYSLKEISIPIRDGDKPLWKRHAVQDIAAIKLEIPTDLAVQPLALDRLADEAAVLARQVRAGQEVFIPGYPAKLAANEAGWPILRRGNVASYPLAPLRFAHTILVNAQTFGGDSGAPVVAVADSGPLVVGLVVGMQRQTDKATLPFQELSTHTPLGLAIVVQAAFIRDTIASLVD